MVKVRAQFLLFFILVIQVKTMNCVRCEDTISSGDELVCTNCVQEYHFHCQGITERNFRKMGKDKLVRWKCLQCKNAEENNEEEKNVLGNKMDAKEMKIDGIKEYFDQKFIQLNKTIQEQKDEVIKALNVKVKELETKLAERDEKIANLEDRMDMMENRSRIANIEIRNMPETNNENVKYLVECIGKTIGIPNIAEGDIQVAHRVNIRSGNTGARPIVAHLSSRFMRNQWLQSFKDFKKKNNGKMTAKHVNVNGNLPETNIYMYEHITVNRKLLLNEVKAYAKEKHIKFVWVKDGMILVKKDENARLVTKINSKREFEAFKEKGNF